MIMNGIVVVHHIIYLVISIALTVWVGRTLSKNGRIFWVNVFERNEAVADSINRLLILGFYLINFGIVSLFLRFGSGPDNLVEFIELLSIKVGLVFLLLGLMHIAIMFIFKVFKRAVKLNRESVSRPSLATPATEGGSRFFSQSAKAA